VLKEVLAVDAWLCHGGLTIFKKAHHVDLLRNFSKFQDEIDFSVTFIIELTRIVVSLPKLGCATILVDSNGTTLLSREGREMKEVAILHCRFTSGVVHWT